MSLMIQSAAWAGMLVATAVFASPLLADVRREDFAVAGDDGLRLFVREVRDDTVQAAAKPPVILLHGARVPGLASFDLSVPGGSLAADLARSGHRVFIMDARGYGGADRPGQDGPRTGGALARSAEVVRDIGAVVAAVRARTGAERIALLGWATGGHWVGMFASRHPARVSHVVIYNSLYGAEVGHPTLGPGSDASDPQDPTRFNAARFGAYQLHSAASLLPSWDRSIPVDDKTLWRDPAVADAYQRAALASDPTSASRNPPSFRAPSGAIADSFELASGRKLWDASAITAHVLIIRSANDFWSRPADVTTLQQDLRHASSLRVAIIPDATHHVHLDRSERGRDQFLAEVTRFLGRPAGE